MQGGTGNVISGNKTNGIFLIGSGATANLVRGNSIGTKAGGAAALGNTHAGIGISSAPGNMIGGPPAGAGNVVSGNGMWGIYLMGAGASGNVVQGNKVGTDATGNAGLGNAVGIWLDRAVTNTIGGSSPGAGNIISGNPNWGIFMTNNASWNTFQGNLIGTALDGSTALGNGYQPTGFHAVELHNNCHDNLFGGIDPGSGNVIAFAPYVSGIYYAGVRIRDTATNNRVVGNSVFGHGGLGIDLGAYLVTSNDNCDADSGANMLQNFPLLAQAVSGNGTGIRGALNARPNSTFLLQFFANPVCDGANHGEGQLWLGQMSIATDSGCNASFVAHLLSQVPPGYVVTSTATDSANNTSEFSACVPVTAVPLLLATPLPASHQLRLGWTNTATGFVLKETSSLSPTIQWSTVTNVPVNANGQFSVTVSTAGGNRFYALRFE